jgi:hypothetical protein
MSKVDTFNTTTISKQAKSDTSWIYTWASNRNISYINASDIRRNESLMKMPCTDFAMNQVPDESFCDVHLFRHAYVTTVWHIVFYVIYLFFVIVGLASGQATTFLRCCRGLARGILLVFFFYGMVLSLLATVLLLIFVGTCQGKLLLHVHL